MFLGIEVDFDRSCWVRKKKSREKSGLNQICKVQLFYNFLYSKKMFERQRLSHY